MKLKKFTKNKKIKIVLIGSITGILLIIGGISLYRTFALYKEEKTFDVLQGTVPDFVYKEDILNGAYPVLKSKTGEKLIPVQIDNTGKVTKADIKDEWYSYEDKKWANAVILVDGVSEPKNDEEIPEEKIESYFVWIPKYRYKIFDMGNYSSIEGGEYEEKSEQIEIEFGLDNTQNNFTNSKNEEECATPNKSGEDGECTNGKWMTHPAFTSFENIKGIWVGKFETGYKDAKNTTEAQVNSADTTKVIIKPNVYSWRKISVENIYQTSYNYQRKLDSHMMKNTEWGAVTYLSHSKYGTCNEFSCKEVRINNSQNFVTGSSAIQEPMTGFDDYKDYGSVTPGIDANETGVFNGAYNYKTKDSTVASTTGNYSGIYDMSGGAWEYVAGVIDKDSIQAKLNGLNTENIIDEKYIDLYTIGTAVQFNGRILGDATGELGRFNNSQYNITRTNHISSWYKDFAYMVNSSNGPYFMRGGRYALGIESGIFAFSYDAGAGTSNIGYRIVLAPQ